MPEIDRIDLVQGDAQRITFHAVSQHPTAGSTAMASLAGATAIFRMRMAGSASNPLISVVGTIASAAAGLIDVNLPTSSLATPGQYRAQLTIDFGPSVGIQTVPKDEPYQVQVRALV